jgi:hypothetical protein
MATGIRRANRDDPEFLAWVMLSASRAYLSKGISDLNIGAGEQPLTPNHGVIG